MYDKFERSSEASVFKNYSYSDATLAWIDILNVRTKSHDEISKIMRKVLDLAAEATSTGPIFNDGVYFGTPNSAVQYAIVGDTVIMVEKYLPDQRAAAKLALLYRASLFSKKLFENNFLHRGIILDGPVDCFQKDHNPIITGGGVVQAYTLEAQLKCSGLFIHDSCALLKSAGRFEQTKQHDRIIKLPVSGFDHTSFAPNTSYVIFEKTTGLSEWQNALKNAEPHEKVTNSFSLIQAFPSP